MTGDQFRRLALALPGAFEAPHFQFTSFRVAGAGAGARIFATMPPEQTHVHLFIDESTRDLALAMDPVGLEKLHWGQRVLGVRVALASTPAPVIQQLLEAAHAQRRARAPRRRNAPR